MPSRHSNPEADNSTRLTDLDTDAVQVSIRIYPQAVALHCKSTVVFQQTDSSACHMARHIKGSAPLNSSIPDLCQRRYSQSSTLSAGFPTSSHHDAFSLLTPVLKYWGPTKQRCTPSVLWSDSRNWKLPALVGVVPTPPHII
jgi:hypothetical protein